MSIRCKNMPESRGKSSSFFNWWDSFDLLQIKLRLTEPRLRSWVRARQRVASNRASASASLSSLSWARRLLLVSSDSQPSVWRDSSSCPLQPFNWLIRTTKQGHIIKSSSHKESNTYFMTSSESWLRMSAVFLARLDSSSFFSLRRVWISSR